MRYVLLFLLCSLFVLHPGRASAQSALSTVVLDVPDHVITFQDAFGLPDGGFVAVGHGIPPTPSPYSATNTVLAYRYSKEGMVLWERRFAIPDNASFGNAVHVVNEEVFVGVTSIKPNAFQSAYLWRLRLADGIDVSTTELVHANQEDLLGRINGFAIIDDAVVVTRPILNWSRRGLLETVGIYTFGLDGAARNADYSFNWRPDGTPWPAVGVALVNAGGLKSVDSSGTVNPLPRAHQNSSSRTRRRDVVVIGDRAIYMSERLFGEPGRFLIAQATNSGITTTTKDFPTQFSDYEAFDFLNWGLDSFSVALQDASAQQISVHVFSKEGVYGRPLPTAVYLFEGSGSEAFAISESPAGPKQRRYVFPPRSRPNSVVRDLLSGDTIAVSPNLSNQAPLLDDIYHVTFYGRDQYVGVKNSASLVTFSKTGQPSTLPAGAFDAAGRLFGISNLYGFQGGSGYMIFGSATSGRDSVYVLNADLSLRTVIPASILGTRSTRRAVDPRGGVVIAALQGVGMTFVRIDPSGSVSRVGPFELAVDNGSSNVSLRNFAVGPNGEFALSFTYVNDAFSTPQGLVLEVDQTGVVRINGCATDCQDNQAIVRYTPSGDPFVIDPLTTKYQLYGTSGTGTFEVLREGTLYSAGHQIADVKLLSADSVLAAIRVADAQGRPAVRLDYYVLSSRKSSTIYTLPSPSYPVGRMQVSPAQDIIVPVVLGGAYSAIVIGKLDGTVGIQEITPVSRRLRVENPVKEQVSFRYTSPTGIDSAPREAYLVDAAGRRSALGITEELGEGRYRVALEPSLAAGTYALVVDGEAALVVVQQ